MVCFGAERFVANRFEIAFPEPTEPGRGSLHAMQGVSSLLVGLECLTFRRVVGGNMLPSVFRASVFRRLAEGRARHMGSS